MSRILEEEMKGAARLAVELEIDMHQAKAGTGQNDRSNDEDYWYHRRCGSRQKHSFELPGKAFVCLCHTGGPGRSSGYGTRRTLLCSGDRFIWKNIVKMINTIDRKAVSDVVFCNEQMRCRLNEIIHPAVKAFILERIEEEQKNGRGLFVVEAALLLEDHYDTICIKSGISIPIRKYGYSALWKAEATAARRQRALLQVRRQRLIFVHMQIMW